MGIQVQLLTVFGALVLMAGAACGGNDRAVGTATPPMETATGNATSPASPTDVPDLPPGLAGRVAEATIAGDAQRIKDLLHLRPIPCNEGGPGRSGEPACPVGTPQGTPIGSYFGLSDCQGSVIDDPDAAAGEVRRLSREQVRPRFVVTAPEDAQAGSPAVAFLIFEAADGKARVIKLDNVGAISLEQGCSMTVEQYLRFIEPHGPITVVWQAN